MNNEEKSQEICEKNKQFHVECSSLECYLSALEMAQWKDEQFKQQLNSLKDEIKSNLCVSSGFNDEYSQGYQDYGMKVMEMIDKILEL